MSSIAPLAAIDVAKVLAEQGVDMHREVADDTEEETADTTADQNIGDEQSRIDHKMMRQNIIVA